MNQEFIKALIEAIELVSATANLAWWHNHAQHCGSDYHVLTCNTCYAYEQCGRNEKLIVLFCQLLQAVD